MVSNKQFIFNAVPVGMPKIGSDLIIKTVELDLETVPLHQGILTKTVALSLDPYMRGRMRAPEAKSYSPPFELGKPIGTLGVSKVIRSEHKDFPVGAHVYGYHSMEEYNIFTTHHIIPTGLKILKNEEKLNWTQWVGAAGMPGWTAFYSYTHIGTPKKGETIYVSAASGAVGMMVVQLAKRDGLKVIASAGDDKKVEFIKSLGADVVFNYKTQSTKEILEANPFDIFYDNVGGEQLEIVLNTINTHGRIIACGAISDYNKAPEDKYPIRSTFQVIAKQLRYQGFIISGRDSTEFYATVPPMIAAGELKLKEQVYFGIEAAGQAFVELLDGTAFGKVVLSLE